MNGGSQTKTSKDPTLKFHLRTLQMDLDEARGEKPVKEVEIAAPARLAPAAPKIAFDKIAQELKPKPPTGGAKILEKETPKPILPKPEIKKEEQPKIELRPLPRPEVKISPPKEPAYKPQTPPLRPQFGLGRELETEQKAAKGGLKIPKILWVVLIIVVLGTGFYLMGGVEFIKGLLTPLSVPPTTEPPTQTPPVEQQPPPQQPPPSIAKTLEVARSQPANLRNTLRSVLAENYPLNSLNQTGVVYLEDKKPLTFKQFWQALGVIPPFGLIDSLEENFELVVYTNSADAKRFGLIAKIRSGADMVQVKNQLLSWEQNFVSDWQILLSSLPVAAQGQFQNIMLYRTASRFINTDLSDLGIYYAILSGRGVVVIGTSRETLENLIIKGL